MAETFARDSLALHSHLLWLMDLHSEIEDPSSRPTIQPFISQIVEHQSLVQALVSDFLALLRTNSMFVQRDLAISSPAGQVPKETPRNLGLLLYSGTLCFTA